MFFDEGNGFGRNPLLRNPLLDSIKHKVINHLKENDSPLGDALEKINNAVESFENFHDTNNSPYPIGPSLGELFGETEAEFDMGDHIAVRRMFYTHHGIYDGHGGVYEYNDYEVRHSSLSDFANGGEVYRFYEDSFYSPREIIYRAQSRLGEEDYNLVFNNCQHFATWCRLGEEI